MKKIMITAILFITGLIIANAQSTGIKFEKGLEWSQILDKAKSEHKYIFVDCYATWCGPCKQMDADVYPRKDVGEIYNKQFISVKVQMDRTANDDSLVKDWYGVVYMFSHNYTVNAYPTFLFFDPDGKAVHRVAGGLDAAGFIQLAADAQNPEKQYYEILNFQPGKLDTAEEKGLARSFQYSDRELAAKIALDYLTRIPVSQLSMEDNGLLMIQFQDNPQVLSMAINYLNSHEKRKNLSFIIALSKQPQIKQVAIDYIRSLNDKEFAQERNLKFINGLNKDSAVQQLAKDYIARIPEDSLYSKKMITFLSVFTRLPEDRGFDVFYHHAVRVDTLMKSKKYAQHIALSAINRATFLPAFNKAKETGAAPDFDSIATVVNRNYNADYADQVIINGKVSWYSYLVNTKKQTQYWPELIDREIDQTNKTFDFATDYKAFNEVAYSYIFLHSENTVQINIALNWLKKVLEKAKKINPAIIDTYACLLYKAGHKTQAIKEEKKALQLSTDKDDINVYHNSITEMQQGKPIWLDKERQ